MSTTAVFDPVVLDQLAYKESTRLSPAEQATFLLETVGARVTAAALNLADARPLYRWRDGTEPKKQVAADRLRLLFRIGFEVEKAYGPRVLSAFLRSTNPQLGDRSPLVVLADNDPAEVEVELLDATRAFLEG
jgi:hypothetical protein